LFHILPGLWFLPGDLRLELSLEIDKNELAGISPNGVLSIDSNR
jgi:hypothetical protein